MTLAPIKPIYWLWLPVIVMIAELLGEIFIPRPIYQAIHSEYGPHEMFEWFFITAAACVAGNIFVKMDRKANKWLTMWVLGAFIACIYISVEEISWGQTFLHWGTPEFWAEINKQDETNFHNTSTWLNQKPRMLLELGVFIGGVIIPALRRWKPAWLPEKFKIIYPDSILSVTAGLFAAYRIANFIAGHVFDYKLFARPSEVGELYMFYFTLLYLILLRRRLYPKGREKAA